MFNIKSVILKQILIKPEIFEMVLSAPEIAAKSKPGQFIQIKVNDNGVLLRRPMSIVDADASTGELKIWYRVVGKGTLALAKAKEGEILDIIGPLGNSFYVNENVKTIALVGGGCGVAPLVFFSKIIAVSNPDVKIYSIVGARNKDLVLGEENFANYKGEVCVATDDGSAGKKGFTTDVLKELLKTVQIDQMAACGPEPMMEAVAKICREKNIPCLVSMESPMACGLGACCGCVVKTKIGYRRVCKEGPIFRGADVFVK